MKAKKIYKKKIDWNSKKAKEFLDEPRIRKMLSLVGTNKKVLDVGCFTGDIALEIKKKGNEVVGIDCNIEFVKMTQKKGIDAKFANFEEKFPFKNESFDLIVAGEIIEHIYHTENFLKECHRILKKDGEIIITTPNINYWVYRIKMLFGKTLPFGIESGEDTEFPGHIRYYTFESMEKTLKNYNFEIEKKISSNIINRSIIKLEKVAELWPSIGYHIIVKAKKYKPKSRFYSI